MSSSKTGTGRRILVGQSGGPTAVINASLYGIIQKARSLKPAAHVCGMIHGILGYLDGEKMELDSLSSEELELMKTTPGSYLGSCRCHLPEDLSDPVYETIMDRLHEDQIDIVLYIGGNDSMDTLDKLSRYASLAHSPVRFMGIPKTIDNDLLLTDHTPGYGSAAKFVASAVRQMVMDAEVYQQEAVTIVEIMGRSAGWLTAASVAARKFPGDNPVLIYLPEVDFDEQQMIRDVRRALCVHSCVVVCVSEGIHEKDGTLLCEKEENLGLDPFGHRLLAGAGKYLEHLVRRQLGIKARSVELNITQRCWELCASLTDQQEAEACGAFGLGEALEGKTGGMVALKRSLSNKEYTAKLCTVDVSGVSNTVRSFPLQWITPDGHDIRAEYLSYVMPLMQGTVSVPEKEGLPVFLYRKPL